MDVTRQAQAVAEARRMRWWTRRSRSVSPCEVSATPCKRVRHAVEAEDFESAARLRDQLKALPQH